MKAARAWFALQSRNSRQWAALLCLGLFFVLQIFATSSSLHQKLHSESAAPDHHCVITLFSHGQVNVSDATVGCVLAVVGFPFALPWFYTAAVSSFDYRLAPSRGPPRF